MGKRKGKRKNPSSGDQPEQSTSQPEQPAPPEQQNVPPPRAGWGRGQRPPAASQSGPISIPPGFPALQPQIRPQASQAFTSHQQMRPQQQDLPLQGFAPPPGPRPAWVLPQAAAPPQGTVPPQRPPSQWVSPPPGYQPPWKASRAASPAQVQRQPSPVKQHYPAQAEVPAQDVRHQSPSGQFAQPGPSQMVQPAFKAKGKGRPQEGQKEGTFRTQELRGSPPISGTLKERRTPATSVGGKEGKEVKLELALAERKQPRTGGSGGRKIQLETNHFQLDLSKMPKQAIHYDVAIEPDTPKIALRSVMNRFREKYYPKRYPAFDGRKNLYSSSRLPFGDEIVGEVDIELDDRQKSYKVKIKFAAMVDLSAIETFLTATSSGQRHGLTPQDAIHCIDVVLRSAPAMYCIGVGRSFFSPPKDGQILDLGDGMQMYYGFYQSAILGWKPFLNVDVAHKGFPKQQSMLDLLNEFFGKVTSLTDTQRDKLEKYVKNLKIQYEIPNHPSTKRNYRVNGVRGTPDTSSFLNDQNNREMTISNYFLTEKAYRLHYPRLPCIWVGKKDRQSPVLLPLELCTVLENQAVNRKMNEIQTSKMIRYAATNTTDRKNKILNAVNTVKYNESPCAREFGFSVSNKFEKVEGRVLDPPNLLYSGNQTVLPSRGVWRNDRKQFFKSAELMKWIVLCLDRRTREDTLQQLSQMISRTGQTLGMQIAASTQPTTLQLRFGKELEELKTFFVNKRDYKLIVVVIPDQGPFYSYVKQAAELNVGCLTQCVKARTLYKSLNPTTIGNILLKVNAKLNGTNHVMGNKPECLKRPCMFMGADVTHPSPDSQNIPSVAAVTASHDPTAFRYNICWRLQPPKVEIIEDLEAIVKEQLEYFYKSNNGSKPEKIIFFRDGVSEGQFEIVMNVEVQAIRRACASMGNGDYKPKITFLVVQKRHHTRFFPTNSKDSEDRNLNVPAGTCVDTVITHPTAQDFYLVSHASIQGVAKPTKYRTLWDDNDMSDNELEQLTYYLCHMFTRCNRSVSYPAPTYYAHLAAARAKVYCENKQLNLSNLAYEQSRLTIKDAVVKAQPMFFV